jgi:hypothetical protein
MLEVMTQGNALGSRSGTRPGDGGLTTTLAGSVINVSAGGCFIYQPNQGVYRAVMTASSSPGSLAAAHATLTRIDLVYIRVWDNAVDSSGLFTGDVVYLAGTPASSPVAPTPAGTQIYMPLATITVPPVGGGSASVSTAVRPVTVAPGGICPDTATPGYYAGQYRDNGAGLDRYNGSAWVSQTPKASAAVQTTTSSATTTSEVTTGMTITMTTKAGSQYELVASGLVRSTVQGDRVELRIRRGTTTGATQVGAGLQSQPTNGTGYTVVARCLDTPGAGSTTWTVFVARGAGTGTVDLTTGATLPAQFTVREI